MLGYKEWMELAQYKFERRKGKKKNKQQQKRTV